jgi:addiction module HigA family antidote
MAIVPVNMRSESTSNTGFVSFGETATRMKSKLRIITEVKTMALDRRTPAAWAIHPGEILLEEFLRPLGITGYALAKAIGVKPQSVNDIVLEKRGISAEMALRLSRYFGNSPEFWSNLQSAYELAKARTALKKQIAKIQPRAA